MGRKIPTEDLIEELERLADELGESPTRGQMDELGAYSRGVYRTRFGSWNNALKEVGLETNHEEGKVKIDCEECGDTFPIAPHRQGRAKYCSVECKDAAHSKRMSGEGAPWWNGGMVELSCVVCGSPFIVKPYRKDTAQCCSPECRSTRHGESIQGEDHPRWVEYPEIECEACGKTLTRTPAVVERANHHFCDRTCYGQWISEHRSGPASWNWAGGQFPYGAGWDESKRERVRERDARECQECGLGEERHIQIHGRKHHVHHIQKARHLLESGVGPEVRNHPDNLVTLCHGECHKKWEAISPFRPTIIGRS